MYIYIYIYMYLYENMALLRLQRENSQGLAKWSVYTGPSDELLNHQIEHEEAVYRTPRLTIH